MPRWRVRRNQVLHRLLTAAGMRFVRVDVRGRPLWVDLKDMTLGRYFYVYRDYEPFEASLIERAARPGMSVADIGANVGYYTVLMGHRVGPTGRVVAFEPDETNYSLLRRSVEANLLTNVVCERAAVMGSAGTASLYLSATNFGDHRVFDAHDEERFNEGAPRARVDVSAVVLDDYLDRAGIKPDLIKVDIQGAEMTALPGMRRALSRRDVILFCEFWPYGLRRSGSEPGRFLESLLGMGLELHEIDDGSRSILSVDPAELSARYPDLGLANLICCHPARARALFEDLGVPIGRPPTKRHDATLPEDRRSDAVSNPLRPPC